MNHDSQKRKEELSCLKLLSVGLSNILDREGRKKFEGREPIKRAHRIVIGASLMESELGFKVSKAVKAVRVVETLLIFAVTSFDLAVVPGCVGPDQFVDDMHF